MANTIKKLYAGIPNTVSGTLYTVPADTKTILKQIVLCNTSASDATITITASGVTIISSYSVTSKDTVIIDLATVLEATETITGVQGTSNAITAYISGVEVA